MYIIQVKLINIHLLNFTFYFFPMCRQYVAWNQFDLQYAKWIAPRL